ncbi:Lectin receptor kinase [Quillaja saponaria]|uniref:Lectin receptor kinase n=1 Tax=Quillaja saponaria TaxID=32244 RepID=A0AAD7PX77_QUISA|nr:Lectin receptor kinase [Quillaja saponaria]
MAIFNSKSYSVLFIVFVFFLLQLNNVLSFSFNFINFHPGTNALIFEGDAFASNGVLQLTKNQVDTPINGSAGRASYSEPLHLWDAKTGKLADFTTQFTFFLKTINSSLLFGDGFSFFLAPVESDIPNNSSGAYLGLFSEETALDASKNDIVAVEFDTYGNTWDPSFPHVGVDINQIKSLVYAQLASNIEKGSVATALINYNSTTKFLDVLVTYADKPAFSTKLTVGIDLAYVLPEWVRIGFSGATGQLVEIHDIVSWSFTSTL